MGENSGLCLRFDIDTFSTRHKFIADVGDKEYDYLQHVLRIAKVNDVKFQFCTCGQGLKEHPVEHEIIKLFGQPIDSHLYTHRIGLYDDILRIAEELVLTEKEFNKHMLPWSGIGATGMYPDGIDGKTDVQKLLVERGYQWCSTKYNSNMPLEKMQPYWLDDFLLEIPCAGLSDRNYFKDEAAAVEGFIEHVKIKIKEAVDKDLIYCVVLHAGVLSKFDPYFKFITEVVGYAGELEIPLLTMDQISQWKIANYEETEPVHRPEKPTLMQYINTEKKCAIKKEEKVFDYLGGSRLFPNYIRPGASTNRFGLGGEDFLRTKPKGMKRVLCIGDSCVIGGSFFGEQYGNNFPNNIPWPSQLQKLLDKKKPDKYQILNAGVGGHRVKHVIARLPRFLRLLKPDAVIISVLANNLFGTVLEDINDLSDFIPNKYIEDVKKAVNICIKNDAVPYICTNPGIFPKKAEMTSYMKNICHQPPLLGETKQPDKMRLLYDKYNNALRKTSEQMNVYCIDVAKYFDDFCDEKRDRMFLDTCHTMGEGKRETAEFISKEIIEKNII